ncbi:MAG TPA: phospholipase C, phosphocholine-specific [Burkholderiales bacterium]|nr:phospholipase C, phosphocholine-specific [Burkholderiales bacterium]
MSNSSRRDFLRTFAAATGAAVGASIFPPSIRKALAIGPKRVRGTIEDVEHVVILTQENRSFDHYFGTLSGVRGFGDRFPLPAPDAPGMANRTVWYQPMASGTPQVVAPFHLDTEAHFELMRVEGTPHAWPDSQGAWGDGQMKEWPRFKHDHAMGYFTEQDMPFQFSLAEAFTICDAYFCSFMGNTNPNRLFLWTGTNDPLQKGGGPALYNQYDNVDYMPAGGYTWVTYCERLQQAGVSWQIYQDMANNFTDNSVAGFRTFRASYFGEPGSDPELKLRGLSTRDLDLLQQDVVDGKLPQVSWIVATAEGSEHPGPSSPAQGADYTARVLEALTANPEVWAKTVFFVNFDENDGFFDHVPPPAAPSYELWDADESKRVLAGGSTVNTIGEYHELVPVDVELERAAPLHKPYGLGPRVPMYVISPWSKGGWVNSEVFDHTSVIQFLEVRFGVREPNISAWRRAVTGDLTSAFNFRDPDDSEFYAELPDTVELAERATALPGRTTPATPKMPELPVQDWGVRPSRALPYELHAHAKERSSAGTVALSFANTGRAGAVFHVYDQKHLERIPRRYTVGRSEEIGGEWDVTADGGAYDLWLLGPNGFHRHFTGDVSPEQARVAEPEVRVDYDQHRDGLRLVLRNRGDVPCTFSLHANAYQRHAEPQTFRVGASDQREVFLPLKRTAYWYDYTVRVAGLDAFSRRFAGRMETGRHSLSDPAMGGRARGDRS